MIEEYPPCGVCGSTSHWYREAHTDAEVWASELCKGRRVERRKRLNWHDCLAAEVEIARLRAELGAKS